MTQKVILDTDIGSDIDDAVCLAYLLANPDCDLLGITTVTGQPELRACLASVLCTVAGKSIPIFPGAEQPLLREQLQPKAPQAEALARWEHKSLFPKGHAIGFLRDTIRANPGEITLLTIGPLTNIALLFKIDPEIPSLLKSLVMMCGVFTNHLAGVGPLEWNAMLDPHATAIMYRQAAAARAGTSWRSVGLDVTCQVTMPAGEVRSKFSPRLLQPVLDFAEVWFRHVDKITFHDPLAGVTLFDDQVCQFTRGQVEVELESSRLAGLTHWKAQPEGPHEVALTVNSQRFFEHYFSVF
jgi:inosine-uridine nucleoside N-ribohydrolase